MIVPNYINYKAGLCTDLEYFKFSYAGKDGEVAKKFTKKLGKRHPFFVIKRPLEPLYGRVRYEFKIYDFHHSGYIEKQVIVECNDEDNKIEIPSLEDWWSKQNKGATHFKDYVKFCDDSKI